MSPALIDQTARDQALDISQSFIVQAPAGSGKTGLLTLRYLRLLSVSEQPEQVLAITFTKKAASEMRNRIMQTLFWARELDQDKEIISSHFDTQRLRIANEVLSKDKECSWNLLENPSRLRVQTIDSFCFYLAKQLPVMSRIGGNPTITENTDQCFRDSIANTLRHLDEGHKISSDLEKIQIHLDNDVNRLERLLKNLLLKRDQWLPYILDIDNNNEDAKAYLQTCLEELITESIEEVKAALYEFKSRVIELANFSLTNLKEDEPTRFTQLKNLSSIPSSEPKDRESWSLIINLLLTKDGTWRKAVNKLNGFPTGDGSKKDQQALYKLRKKQFLELKDELICKDGLLESLNYLRLLPNPSTSQQQWDFITSLTNILAQLSSELLLSFRRFMLIDYTEASAAARTALGSDTNPTDLALALDHNIRHILVDEFQDTSQSQLDMLLQLTNGWEIHDERTLFLVGDAMQSCYGFRNANVGIYLNVQQNGLPNIVVNNLQLSANFRSEPGIVDWINNHFETAFPIKPNPSKGAVPYSPSTAVKPSGMLQAVDTEIITYSSDRRLAAKAAEAKQVIAHINKLRGETNAKNTESIAILVRSRNHLMQIANELHSSNIAWESTDIDRIGAMQIIEDLLSLTKALLNPHDRLSWFATLRAPWLGLVLSDLNTIANHSKLESVWEVILNWQNIQGLSSDGKSRLKQFVKCMSYGMEFRYQLSLREIVESTWILLRGAAVIETKREIACVSFYLELLDTYEQAGGIRNLNEFQEKVLNSFIPIQVECPQSEDEVPVQLLTIHKAK
ncbi:MAG: DNA helicase UvrD, partial [Gammaproteobacteria bacterium]|nr:DNA helicase UvrD [Gammaproteobacteria bacterium]